MNPDRIKSKIRELSLHYNLSPQELLQMLMFERFLSRVEKSKYQDYFILKGGLLIASMVGAISRTTMDMDATVQGLKLTHKNVVALIDEILSIRMEDNIVFEMLTIKTIREMDVYENFRVHLIANLGKVRTPLKIDLTTGDKITPTAIEFEFTRLLEEGVIRIKAYPIETILAEKYETILKRNIATTRMRDFYDVHILLNRFKDVIDISILREAIIKTATHRDSMKYILDAQVYFDDMNKNVTLKEQWKYYLDINRYISKELDFEEVLKSSVKLNSLLEIDVQAKSK